MSPLRRAAAQPTLRIEDRRWGGVLGHRTIGGSHRKVRKRQSTLGAHPPVGDEGTSAQRGSLCWAIQAMSCRPGP